MKPQHFTLRPACPLQHPQSQTVTLGLKKLALKLQQAGLAAAKMGCLMAVTTAAPNGTAECSHNHTLPVTFFTMLLYVYRSASQLSPVASSAGTNHVLCHTLPGRFTYAQLRNMILQETSEAASSQASKAAQA